MVDSDKKIKGLSFIISALLVMVCGYLSLSAYFSLVEKYQSKLASFNVFTDKKVEDYQRLESVRKRLNERNAFMVFSDEQNKIHKQLIKALHSQINLKPYEVELWKGLAFNQSAANTSIGEREWTFLVWKNLHQWNPHEHTNLIDRCVVFVPEQTSSMLNKECQSLFEIVLKKKKTLALAQQLKLPLDKLDEVLSHYDVQISPLNGSVDGVSR